MIVDIIIIAILALSIFLGYKKGLIELSIKLCAGIIAIVAVLILYRPITSLIINNTNIDEKIQETIMSKSSKAIQGENEQNTKNENINNEKIDNKITNEIIPEAAKELSYNIIRAVVMIVLYIIIKIALRFVTAIANLIAKLPVLNQFNKVGGVIYGAIRGLLIIYVALLIVSFIGQINTENVAHKEIEKSFIGKEMYNRNIIELLVK